jgi:hypothetical protein
LIIKRVHFQKQSLQREQEIRRKREEMEKRNAVVNSNLQPPPPAPDLTQTQNRPSTSQEEILRRKQMEKVGL